MTQTSPKRKPASPAISPQRSDSAADGIAADASQCCVLLVEDEALIAEVIGETLADAGYAVHAVANATDAMAHLSAGARVDILFTDINLPGEVDGVGLAEQVRALNPDLPVVFASGRWWRLDKLDACPNTATLRKPYSPARACETVEMLLSGQSGQHDDAGAGHVAALAL